MPEKIEDIVREKVRVRVQEVAAAEVARGVLVVGGRKQGSEEIKEVQPSLYTPSWNLGPSLLINPSAKRTTDTKLSDYLVILKIHPERAGRRCLFLQKEILSKKIEERGGVVIPAGHSAPGRDFIFCPT